MLGFVLGGVVCGCLGSVFLGGSSWKQFLKPLVLFGAGLAAAIHTVPEISWSQFVEGVQQAPVGCHVFAGVVVCTYALCRLVFASQPPPVNYKFKVDTQALESLEILNSLKGGYSTGLDQIPAVVRDMKRCYLANVSRSLETRKHHIRQLLRFLQENEQVFVDALKQDLNKPQFQSLSWELGTVITEATKMLNNLDEWLTPSCFNPTLVTFPSSQWVQQDPYGTVLIIGTWNFPVQLTMSPLLGALAAGNTVVLKPANLAPAVFKVLVELLPQYLPPTVVQVVGQGLDDIECTKALIAQNFDMVFYTGSQRGGSAVSKLAAEHLTPCVLELGGKNCVYVDESADVDLAARRVVWGRFINAGQQCIAPDYALVHSAVIEQFQQAVVRYTEEMFPANPDAFCRIVCEPAFDRLVGMLESHNGQVLCGGTFNRDTLQVFPTVVRCDLNDKVLMQEEIFGPILPIAVVGNVEQAASFINTLPHSLSMYAFTSDTNVRDYLLTHTRNGSVCINATLLQASHQELPFGGVGKSGAGAYHGKHSLMAFSHSKPVVDRHVWPDGGLISDPFFLYPPWTEFKIKVVRKILPYV
eukprot:m.360155 g.360155  ORF g.360155 m.360155 type:complete len:584 (-) comp18905_c0_seq1:193-1944(-)